jgi:glycosyltransferase involved in cell wall biosynthesis
MAKKVLIVSIAFLPNVGGIETHFDDLVSALSKRNWHVDVLTYKPITTNIKAGIFEKRNAKIRIFRVPWFGGFFYKLVSNPVLEFLYLFPGLFVVLPFYLIVNRKVNMIHSHGLIAGAISVFWGKLFGKRVITTTHSIYDFPQKGLYRKFAKYIFDTSDVVLTLSKQSKKEIEKLGIKKTKVKVFTYWIDLKKFKPIKNAKKKLGWENKFVVLFVGRLVEEKGVNELLEAAKLWNKNITLVIAGTGPLEEKIRNPKSEIRNLIYLGKVDNKKLPIIVPSTHEEGFGRVILESLACGTPVIGAKRGAIPEAMDETVGELIDVTSENLIKTVENFKSNPSKLKRYTKNARRYAVKKYSERNVESIIKTYKLISE